MVKRILLYTLVAIASTALTTALQPMSYLEVLAQQQTGCRTFKETGKAVCGRFLQYWLTNGGLPRHGLPISDEFMEKSDLDDKTYRVQYFERAVFELHPENKPPYDVLLSQLGTFRFKQKYPNGMPGAISGTLTYPGEAIPPLKVSAIATTGGKSYSVDTRANQQTFAIDGVEPGTYYVVARPVGSTSALAGGYTKAVACGLAPSCFNHLPIAVTVKAGETVEGVQVHDWFAPPGTLPPPIYTNIREVRYEQPGSSGRNAWYEYFITTFQTDDAPETVLSRYKAVLEGWGWETQKAANTNKVAFIYRGPKVLPGCKENEPAGPCFRTYYLEVQAVAAEGGATDVAVTLSFDTFCCAYSKSTQWRN